MKFFKSIKFRLTFWYSLVLFLFSLGFILLINLQLTNYYQNDPAEEILTAIDRNSPRKNPLADRLRDLNEAQREIIEEIRDADLERFRKISLFSIIPFTILSFVGGYLVAEATLMPLKKLNSKAQSISTSNLSEKLEKSGSDDEIDELIGTLNRLFGRLDKSFKSQGEFVENASHELKTPLTIIKTNLEDLEMDKYLSKTNKETVGEIKKSIDFTNKIIEDLLMLSIPDSRMNCEKTNIYDLAGDVAKNLEKIAQKKGIEIIIDSKSQPKAEARVNKNLIVRSLENLIENAIKYSEEDSKIEIKIEKKKKDVLIRIKDYGEGIPEDKLDMIFDRFYRVDKSRARETGGTGLGLSIVKKIIEMHGGSVDVNSVEGEGSEFVVRLGL